MSPSFFTEACRSCRQTLMRYRQTDRGFPVNMDGCFDHALLCSSCYGWAARNGFHERLKKYAAEKAAHMTCPVCESEMKVNFDFTVAKCFQCGLTLSWADPLRMVASFIHMVELMERRRGRKAPSVGDYMLKGLTEL